MSSPYTSVSISGYNASPPDDDGTFVSTNAVKWSAHTNKIGDPLKAAIESIDANVQAAFTNVYGQTQEEADALVTPINFARFPTPIRDLSRYVSDNTGLVDISSELTDAIKVNKNELIVPDGTYLLGSSVPVLSNTRMIGMGKSSLFRLGADTNVFDLDGVSNVTLKDFAIDGQFGAFTATTNNAINSPANGTGCTNITLDGLEIFDIAGIGVVFLAQAGSHSERIFFYNMYVHDTGAHGMICQDYVDYDVWHNIRCDNSGLLFADRPCLTTGRNGVHHELVNIDISGSAAALGSSVHGASLENGEDFTLTNFNIRNTIGFGLELAGAQEVSGSSIVITDTTRAGIGIRGSTQDTIGVSLSSVTVLRSAAASLDISKGAGTLNRDISISGFTSKDAGTIGVLLSECADIEITGALIRDSVQSGVWCNLSDDIRISGKLKDNNTSANAAHAGVRIINTSSENEYELNTRVTGSGVSDYTIDNTITDAPRQASNPIPSFTAADTTPDITLSEMWKTADTTTYTDFDGASGDRDEFYLIADHAAVVSDNANINTANGSNVTLTVGLVYHYIHVSGVWREVDDSRLP